MVAYRQRCVSHKMRNIIAKLPRLMQVKTEGSRHAGVSRAVVRHSTKARAGSHREIHGSVFVGDGVSRTEEWVIYLRVPRHNYRRSRTTNRLERLSRESRRRTKVIPRFPTHRSCLTLLHASLMAASKLWRMIPMYAAMLRQLTQWRAHLTTELPTVLRLSLRLHGRRQ